MLPTKETKYHPEGYSKDSDVLIEQARKLIKKGQKQIASVERYLNECTQQY